MNRTSTPPRVLIVTTEAPDALFGGLGFFHAMLWSELRRRDYPFRTCYLHRAPLGPSQLADYNVPWRAALPFDFGPDAKALNESWSVRVAMQPIIDDWQPDVLSLHENWTLLPFWSEMHKAQFTLHSSHIGMEHEFSRTYPGLHNYWQQKFAVQNARSVVLHSRWARDMVRQHVSEFARPATVFPIGLRFDDYPEHKATNPLGRIVVSFFGRYEDFAKNFASFREAILGLPPAARARIEPRVYGPHCEAFEVLRQEGFAGLEFVSGELKRRALAQTDIVVMPSTRESFGIVGLEALLSNCKLIATPGLGMDEYMGADSACAPDADSLRAALIAAIEDFPGIRAQQVRGEFRRRVAVPEFSIETMTDRYIEVWRRTAEPLA